MKTTGTQCVAPSAADPALLRSIAVDAVASLHAELVLSPKPGLVCPDDRGSHADMDAGTMMRSLFALRHGFADLVSAAAAGASFGQLQAIGVAAERAMRRATGDVNTHRGAIFVLGLLAAAAARCVAHRIPLTVPNLRAGIHPEWRRALACAPVVLTSHGLAMAARHGAGGARREALTGFPTVFETVLPALVAARGRGLPERQARLHALMTAIATTVDTNLLYRGGADGLAYAQQAARRFVAAGGDHDDALRAIGREFVARKLSPGGSADLLAAALFVDRVTRQR